MKCGPGMSMGMEEIRFPARSSLSVRALSQLFDHLHRISRAETRRGSLGTSSPGCRRRLGARRNSSPGRLLIQGDPTPEKVADCLKKIAGTDIKKLDQIRRELCSQVVEAHRAKRRSLLVEGNQGGSGTTSCFPSQTTRLITDCPYVFRPPCTSSVLAQEDRPPPLPKLRPGTKKGTLSVVVTCYEMGSMISEAVRSVWDAKRQPDEVLLVDDGSHGGETLENIRILESYASKNNLPLKVIRQRNQGLSSARNAGLEAANGEFISFLDGDDIMEPQFYHIGLRVLEKYPRLGVVSQPGHSSWVREIPDGFWNAHQPEFPFLFIEDSIVVPCLTRTELLRDLGGYDIRQRYGYADWELGIRMLVSGWPIVTVPMHLFKVGVFAGILSTAV